MTIETLISEETPPLRSSDTVEHALGLLLELRVRHLPVVDDEAFLVGFLSEDQLLDASGPDARLDTLLGMAPIYVRPDAHVFDATKIMVMHNLSALPVADEERHYVGIVRRHDIFECFARMLSTQESGAILALEVGQRDYSLSQLAYLVEQNDAKILSIMAEAPASPLGTMRITLKLNVLDSTRIRHILDHYGYHVVASFNDMRDEEDLQNRIQEFMRYLEV